MCVCVVVPAAASAQVDAHVDYLARMDADHDGRVSLVEYQDWLSYAFDAMDRDHDGVLAPGELPGGRGQPLTRTQHRARLAEAFRRQDRNGDGFLDARELRRAAALSGPCTRTAHGKQVPGARRSPVASVYHGGADKEIVRWMNSNIRSSARDATGCWR